MAATTNLESFTGTSQLTCSIASLASGSTRESSTTSNTTSKNLDDTISLTFTIASGSPSTSGPAVNIYANFSNDGVLWPIIQLSSGATQATGAGDASIGALGSPPNLRLIGSFGLQTTSSSGERTFRTQPFSVSAALAGELPNAYSIMVENQSGVAFSTSTVSTANYLERSGLATTSGN